MTIFGHHGKPQVHGMKKKSLGYIPGWAYHRYVQLLCDSWAASLAVVSAYLLRFDFHIPVTRLRGMIVWMIVIAAVRPAILWVTQGYNISWRYFDFHDAVRLVVRAVPPTTFLLLVRLLVPNPGGMPYSVIIIDFGLFLAMAGGFRVIRRFSHEHEHGVLAADHSRTLIVGNHFTLGGAIRHLQSHGEAYVVGIISEDADLLGLSIGGVPVLGLPSSLGNLLVTHQIEAVILSGANLDCATEIIRSAAEFDVQVCILPSLTDLMHGKVRVSRMIGIDDITHGRDPDKEGHATPAAVKECFRFRTVLVTGAGGSIGSEIVRQVSALGVARLIVLDHDENSIFELLNEIGMQDFEVIPIIGDVGDRELVRHTFRQYRPEIVLHAAAYKHVPVMETNCSAAVLNNVGGTRELADAAIEFHCKRLVMISTDKAVRPSSVMGATKRVAEMLIQHRASDRFRNHHKTQFACVRFGNVLGSRGSVVPIFLRQIAAGGPITITHEEMTRYFMTIPQAVRLVLQAASLASCGDVYMLDMGDPVKIVDFAKEIIEIAGLTLGKDIAIKIVGTRPGEKLHEQLWGEDATVNTTEFPHVFRVKAMPVPANFPVLLAELENAGHARNLERIISLLHELPIDYRTERQEEQPMAIAN
jgi:FlaA1/EpsC-like NDP-sugar epimerase